MSVAPPDLAELEAEIERMNAGLLALLRAGERPAAERRKRGAG